MDYAGDAALNFYRVASAERANAVQFLDRHVRAGFLNTLVAEFKTVAGVLASGKYSLAALSGCLDERTADCFAITLDDGNRDAFAVLFGAPECEQGNRLCGCLYLAG